MKLLRREKLMAAVGAGLCLFAWLWFRLSRSLGEGAGPMRAFGLLLGRGLCRIFSILPLAMAELVWIGGLLYALFILIDLLRKRGLWGIPAWLCRAVLAAGIIYTLFSVVYLCQYSAPTLASRLGFNTPGYTTSQLYDAAVQLTEELNNYAQKVDRDDDGLFSPAPYKELGKKILESYHDGSMSRLCGRYASGVVPKRGYLLSWALSRLNLSGYYFPPTGESVVSLDLTNTSVPFTTAHEVAHSFGVAPEKEANFAAFLCLIQSDDDDLRFSGLFNGYIYLNNALYSADRGKWQQLWDQVCPEVRIDLAHQSEHVRRHENTTMHRVGTSINDAFIRSTGQPDGVQSYGLVADLIVSYYISQ